MKAPAEPAVLREWLQPGEVSVAHRGVLFLNELPEFRFDILYRSWGCFDNKNGPVVRLRWTDRDLVALAAD